MDNTIQQFLSEYSPLSVNSSKEFKRIFSLKSHKKGDIIAGCNETKENFFLIKEGLVCSYLKNSKGKKIIRTLFSPLSVIASLNSLINEQSVNAEYHCLTDSTILKANLEDFLALVDKHHDISKLYIKILKKSNVKLIKRVTHLTTLEATDRYLLLKKLVPTIEKQIPLYQIASYLNITPIQLSRIRKKLASGES